MDDVLLGFRNIAVHDYGNLNLDIVRTIIEQGSSDLRAFARRLIQQAG